MFPLNGSGGSTAMQGIKLTDVFALLQLLLRLIHGPSILKERWRKIKSCPLCNLTNIPTSDQDWS